MKKLFALASALLAALFLIADVGVGRAADDLGRVAEFRLPDVEGAEHTPGDWKDRKGVVYCFLGVECPVSNGYAAQMQRLADKFSAQGVALVGVYSELGTTAEAARRHGEEYGLRFPRLLDAEQRLAAQAAVKRVPTMVLVGPSGAIEYRGRIDDRWSPEGRRRDVPRTHELFDAVEAVLKGAEPAVRETPTFGCPLAYRKPTAN